MAHFQGGLPLGAPLGPAQIAGSHLAQYGHQLSLEQNQVSSGAC